MAKIVPLVLTLTLSLLAVLGSLPLKDNDTNFVSCVSKYGSDESGCSVSVNCCSSVILLLSDLNNNCQALTNVNKLVIQLKTNVELDGTAHFGKFCGRALPLEISGNNYAVQCRNSSLEVRKNSGAGLYFNSVHGISLSNVTFLNCGSVQTSTSLNVSDISKHITYLFPTTLYLLNCSNVSFLKVTVRDGHGTGVAFFDTVGTVKIINCSFENNRIRTQHFPGGGGLYIEFTNCTPGLIGNCQHADNIISSSYFIKNCYFINNNATLLSGDLTSYVSPTGHYHGMGRGGGVTMYINGNSRNHSIQVQKCRFHNNSAVHGGGLYLQFRDKPSNNIVSIEKCTFENNKCFVYGGGGADTGYKIDTANSMFAINNTIKFSHCSFIGNSAKGHGGGLSLFTTKGESTNFSQTNNIHIEHCQWINNSAFVGSALDLTLEVFSRLGSGGLLPTPTMENCTFESNFNTNIHITTSRIFNASENGLATVYISGYKVKFKSDMVFKHNKGTGLYLSFATVTLTRGTNMRFEGNCGKHGGGINMAAFSLILVHENCSFTFVNNTSLTKGGAILVQSIDYQHEDRFSHSCFMQYRAEPESIQFYFDNNTAKTGVGNILFAMSYYSCKYENSSLFDHIKQTGDANDIAFPASNFALDSSNFNRIVPGREFELNITASDEFGLKLDVVYNAFMRNSPETIVIDQAYTQVSNNTIKFHGNSSASAEILALEAESTTLTFNISLSECPPGFLNDQGSCVCSESKYRRTIKCVGSESYITRGTWIGRCPGEKVCTSQCPPGYCSYNDSKHELLKLPSTLDELSDFVCDKHRSGVLCSECKSGTSVYYHSHYYRCRPNKYCKFGVLFYLMSEILPVSIVFIIVTVFNISIMSGGVNGFVLFAQIADSIDLTAQGSIVFPQTAKIFSYPYALIYRMFNLDFFALEELSFCLWESATALDMMVIKFVAITFALILVVITVLVMNSWKCKLYCTWFRPRTLQAALTHGLTTLIVICFSQCTRVCCLILSHTVLSYSGHPIHVVLYNGSIHSFHWEHLKFAIPAVFFFITVVLIPLTWLLLYPLLFKLLEKCHLNESRLASLVSKLFPIGLLDSFQGCFKDNCRWFAGIYFLYRLLPPFLRIGTNHSDNVFHALLSIQLVSMLALHSAFQPYKQRCHNRVDTFIFANLLILNLMTTYNYDSIPGDSPSERSYKGVVSAQIVLMYLPLVYILCYCLKHMYTKIKSQCSGYFKITGEDLPELRNVTDSNKTC